MKLYRIVRYSGYINYSLCFNIISVYIKLLHAIFFLNYIYILLKCCIYS